MRGADTDPWSNSGLYDLEVSYYLLSVCSGCWIWDQGAWSSRANGKKCLSWFYPRSWSSVRLWGCTTLKIGKPSRVIQKSRISDKPS